MLEVLTGILIIIILGLLVWYQLRSPKMPANALLLFDILQEMGEEVPSDHQSNDKRTVNKANDKGHSAR
jgi:hypothetical protein